MLDGPAVLDDVASEPGEITLESPTGEITLESPRWSIALRGSGGNSIEAVRTTQRLQPCNMTHFVEDVHGVTPRDSASNRDFNQTDLVEDAFISPRDPKNRGVASRDPVDEQEWSLRDCTSDSQGTSMTPRELVDGGSLNTMSPRSWLDVTSDTTRASTLQKSLSVPSQLTHLDRTALRTPRRLHNELEVLAVGNGLHGRDLRRSDDVVPGPTAYTPSSTPSRSATIGREPRSVGSGSWAFLKHVSGEFDLDINSLRTDRSPRFHRPTVSPRLKHTGRTSVMHDGLLVHDLSRDSDVGPGSYDLDRSLSSPSPRINPSARRSPARVEKSPGPTAYQSPDTWEKDWRCSKAKFTTFSSRSRAQMDKSARAVGICRGGDIFLQVSEREQTPGPGAYHQNFNDYPMMPRRSSSAAELRHTGGSEYSRDRRHGYLRATVSSRRKSLVRESSSSRSTKGSPAKTPSRRHIIEMEAAETEPNKALLGQPIVQRRLEKLLSRNFEEASPPSGRVTPKDETSGELPSEQARFLEDEPSTQSPGQRTIKL